jgi:hypothetical protein
MGSPGTCPLFSCRTFTTQTSSPVYQSNCSVGYTMRNRRKSQQAQENPPKATRSGALLLLHPPPRSQQPSNWAMPKQQDSPIPRQTQASNSNTHSNSGLHRHRRHRMISAHASTAHSSHRPHSARSHHHPHHHHHLRSRVRPRTGSIHIWAPLSSRLRWLPLPLLWPRRRQRLILNLGRRKMRRRSLDGWSGGSRGAIKFDWTHIRAMFFFVLILLSLFYLLLWLSFGHDLLRVTHTSIRFICTRSL